MSNPNDEKQDFGEIRATGNSDDHNGNVSDSDGSVAEPSEFYASGNRRNTIRGNASRVQGKWAALALALATVVYILAELVGIATGNKERFKDIQSDVNDTLPAVGQELDNLENVIQDLRTQVEGIPTESPTTFVEVEPGKPGANGEPGKTTIIQQPGRTVYITPAPNAQPTREPERPNARPTTCTLPLGNGCVIP